MTDSEDGEDEDAWATNVSRGGAASGSAATLSRHRMPVCRLKFSPAGSPGALQGWRADATATSDADGSDEEFPDTNCTVSLACSEELEERMSPVASLRQPFSPISNLTGALHNMILQEDADSPIALSPASSSSKTSSPHLAWTTGRRRMMHTIIHDDEEDSSAESAINPAEEPVSVGRSGRASECASDGSPLSFRRSVARPARQTLTLSPEDGDSSSRSVRRGSARDAGACSSSSSPAAQEPVSPGDPYAFSSGRGRRRSRAALAAEGGPAGTAASPGAQVLTGDSSGDENCAARRACAALPNAGLLRQVPLTELRWSSQKPPHRLGFMQQQEDACAHLADSAEALLLLTPQRPATMGRPPRPRAPAGQLPPVQRWTPCSVPALPRALPRMPGAPPAMPQTALRGGTLASAPRSPRPTGGAALPTAAAFKRQRSALACSLFDRFNATVFGGQLPGDLEIIWNARLKTTAGVTRFRREPAATSAGQPRHMARVELSSKVIDAPEKLRSTLLHELCHVAAWVLPPHEHKPPHGPAFRRWAVAAASAHPDVLVTTCHSYDVFAPFRWQCMNPGCAQVYQRHSNSIDVGRQACGRCQNRLAYLGRFQPDGTPARRRPPSAFSAFVRDNFADVRAGLRGTPHREVMQALSAMWRQRKAEEAAGDSDKGLLDITAAFQDIHVA